MKTNTGENAKRCGARFRGKTMTVKQLQNGYKADVDALRDEVVLINAKLAEVRRSGNQALREILLEDRQELQTREQCLVQVIRDLDDVTVEGGL